VPPRMNPSGFASFGRTACTISVSDAEAALGGSTGDQEVRRAGDQSQESRTSEILQNADAV
jgi:hypothetical protein